MKVSIVTLSFNQSAFLEKALTSVLSQNYSDLEYIVVDAGSTDGSREIIEKNRCGIKKVLFEPDEGPADGLNKGFRLATGEIYGFLNSDDILYPNAIEKAVACFNKDNSIDIISGDSVLIDPYDKPIRKLYSDRFSLIRYAYGANFISQQSTFFTRKIFHQVGGFNPRNNCAWDGELYVDMALAGAKFTVTHDVWSGFRSHPGAITASAKIDNEIKTFRKSIFQKIMNRPHRKIDHIIGWGFRAAKHVLNPRGIIERTFKGPVYGRYKFYGKAKS